MNNGLMQLSDMERAAEYIVTSGLFGVRNTAQAIALMLLCQSEGIHPMRAVIEYNIVQGRPTLKSDAMLSRFQAAGGVIRWNTLTEKEASATFAHPQASEVTIVWTIEMAQKAGLTTKDVWRSYPRQMLRSRVISEGVRTVFPGISTGLVTTEEAGDIGSLPPAAGDIGSLPPAAGDIGSLPPPEAADKDPGYEATPDPTSAGRCITEKQRRRLFGIAQESGVPSNIISQYLESLGISSSKDIPVRLYEEIVSWVQSHKDVGTGGADGTDS